MTWSLGACSGASLSLPDQLCAGADLATDSLMSVEMINKNCENDIKLSKIVTHTGSPSIPLCCRFWPF